MRSERTYAVAVVLLLGIPLVALAGGTEEPETTEAAAVPAGKHNEAPMLVELVAAGKLPPVEERLPENPSVAEAAEIGQYGGMAYAFSVNPTHWNDLREAPSRGRSLLQFGTGGTITTDLAERFELSADQTDFTFSLREGTQWSDGAPLTVDDIIFMFEHMHWNEEIPSRHAHPRVMRVVKIDDLTMRMEMDEPNPLILIKMATWQGGDRTIWHPKHYLQKWHIDHNSKANDVAAEEGFDSWAEAFTFHMDTHVKDLNKPTTQAWKPVEITTTTRVFERNPYYWRVDAAGNQLPYIDRIQSEIIDPEVYNLKIISGEASVAYTRVNLADFALFKENEEAGNYRVEQIPGIMGANIGISLNLNHQEPWRAKLYQDVRFRRALSLAINREEVNEAVYFGLATPRQSTALPMSTFYKEEWGDAWAEYDPDRAMRMLDEIGLTERDRDSFRIAPDRKTLQIVIEYSAPGSEALELIKEYWEAVGVKVLLKPLDAQLHSERRLTNEHDARVAGHEGEEIMQFIMGGSYHSCFRSRGLGTAQWRACGDHMAWGWAWGQWIGADLAIREGTKTLADFEGGRMPGEEPPEEIKQLDTWTREWVENTQFGSPEYTELAQRLYDYVTEQAFVIGVVGMAPSLFIAKKNIGNVPTSYGPGMDWPGSLTYYADTLFFRQ